MQYSVKKKEAKAYAVQNQKPVVIYRDPIEGYGYIEESKAAGYDVIESISQYPDATV